MTVLQTGGAVSSGSKRVPVSEAVWGSVTVSQFAQGGSKGPVEGGLWPGQKAPGFVSMLPVDLLMRVAGTYTNFTVVT
jgi:hypothetical protein